MRARAALLLLLVLSGCAGRVETARYAPGELPSWILEEWRNAQEELLELPELTQDPRRFSPYSWEWVQLDRQFWFTGEDGARILVKGLTQPRAGQIIICCGDRETVRHEAFHAILARMRDPRHREHYPELRQ